MNSNYPRQIRYIIGNEACERFSFYGMRSILVIYMSQYLLMPAQESTALFHLFVGACYLTPLIGAFLSDRYWGKYKTILLISFLYCFGHAALALWEGKPGLFVGLTLIAFGAGGVKPCVAAFVGDQFDESRKHLIPRVFDIFYWFVNFGSTTSTLLIPLLLKHYGPSVAFAIPGVLMFVSTIIFWLGRKHYVKTPPNRTSKISGKERAKIAAKVAKVFGMISGFWALYDQHSSSWVLQAKQMNLSVGGVHWEPSQVAAMNPIMLLVMIPLFAKGLYPLLEKRGIQTSPLRRIQWGMVVAGIAFGIVAFYQFLLDQGIHLSVLWQIIPFLCLTASEILVSITGLEYAYTVAPPEMKSTVMGFWYLTIFFGNLITASISEINIFSGPSYFLFFAALVFVMAAVFWWLTSTRRKA